MQPRRSVLLSSPFLWLIGVTLFLPTVKACERVETPAHLVQGAPLTFGVLLTPFLVAELLAILILLPILLRRVEPSRRNWLAALATVLPVLASPAMLVFIGCERPTHLDDQLLVAGSALAIVLAVAVLVAGARGRGWPRLMSTVAGYTIATLPLMIWFVCGLVADSRHGQDHVYLGSVTFVSATLALTVLTAFSLRAITRA